MAVNGQRGACMYLNENINEILKKKITLIKNENNVQTNKMSEIVEQVKIEKKHNYNLKNTQNYRAREKEKIIREFLKDCQTVEDVINLLKNKKLPSIYNKKN